MTIAHFIRETNLDGSLLLGYYGGGNYGDELLLEVLQNMLHMQGVKRSLIAYQQPENFTLLHYDFGYQPFDLRNKVALLKATLASKQVIIGGGGLWGVDMNLNTFQMSVYLWICRWLLGKRVYLLGVGYYHSTSHLGHIGAWFAAKAANRIFARDAESCRNFKRYARSKTMLDKDMAWYIADIPLARYEGDARLLAEQLHMQKPAILLTTRRPQAVKQRGAFVRYNQTVEHYIADNPKRRIILAPLEFSRTAAGALEPNDKLATRANVSIMSPTTNPLTIYTAFKLYHNKLALVGPQFHIMLTAYLTHVPFLPICYDNKVRELFTRIGIAPAKQLEVADVNTSSLQQFINQQLSN